MTLSLQQQQNLIAQGWTPAQVQAEVARENGGTTPTAQTYSAPNSTSSITQLRAQMQTGQLSPSDAAVALQKALPYPASGEPADVSAWKSAWSSALSQLYAPMQINKNGQLSNLNSDGSLTKTTTTVNQSTTTGAGTTSSTSNVNTAPNEYDPNTGQKLTSGQTVLDKNTGQYVTEGQTGETATAPTGGSGGGTTLPSTGNANLDALQNGFSDYISGSLATGFTVNPALSITPETVAQFITEAASQLEPRLQQSLITEITGVNASLGNAVNQYLASQGQTIQDFQQTLGKQRDSAGANGMYMGGGEAALERGLQNSAQRSLSSLSSTAELNIGNTLRAGGEQVGQGFGGAQTNGLNITNTIGDANSFNIPSLYGVNLSLGGGDSTFAGSSRQGNALNFNYNPSTYQYGAIPGQFSVDMSNLVNQTAKNYQQGMVATGLNNITSSSGLTL